MDRKVGVSVYLSVCLFVCLSVCLSAYLSVFVSICLSIYPSIYLSFHLSVYLSAHQSTYGSTYLSVYLPVDLSICLSIYLSVYLSISICLSIYLSVCLSICLCSRRLSIYLSIYLFVYLQAWKRSYSARLPQLSKLTTSKTKQFCETSFKNGKWSAELTALYQCVLRFSRFICLKYCAYREKVTPSHTKCCSCHAKSIKIISANLKIWCSKMQPLSGNQRPVLLTSLMNMSLVLRLPRKMHLCRSSSNVPRLPSFWEMLQKSSRFAGFWQGAQSLAPATRSGIWTSKSGPIMWCF